MKSNSTETSEDRILRMVDIMEIQQVQHRYQQWLALLNYEKLLEQFALHEKATAFDQDARDFVKKYTAMGKLPGILTEHYAICPVIEVAKDRKTAKGTWLSPGILIVGPVNGQVWIWGKYVCDYIKEDGEWKIWHLDWLMTFASDLKKGPLAEQDAIDKLFAETKAKGLYDPQLRERKRKLYSPDEINYLTPEPPEPYDTWEA